MIEFYDVEYLELQEAAARELAEFSGEPQVKRIHLEYADRYASKAKVLRGKRER